MDNNVFNEVMRLLSSRINTYSDTYVDTYTENIINSTLNDEPAYKNVISEDGEKELSTILYCNNNEKFPSNKCPITFIEFEEGNEIIQLPCKHYFIPEGIIKWLKEEKAECPVCRYKFNSIEKKVAIENVDSQQNNTITGISQEDDNYLLPLMISNNDLIDLRNAITTMFMMNNDTNYNS